MSSRHPEPAPPPPALDARAMAYIGIVTLLGMGAAALTLASGSLSPEIEFMVLCGLAVALGSRTVRLWSTIELSVALPFIYAGLMAFGPASATFISLLAALGACIVRARRLNLPRILLNTSVVTGSTAAAAQVYLMTGGQTGRVDLLVSFWPLMASTLVYYAFNSLLIAGIIHLTQGLPLSAVWKENFFWSAPSYFTGSSIGLMIVLLLNSYGLMAFAIALPPSLLIFYFYRAYMERMELQRRQLEQFEVMNRELESKVQERTRELLTANRKLEESNQQLQSTNRIKSQFLANVSHELRTPLNAIIGFSELLLADPLQPLAREQREYTSDILSSGQHLLDLINDILDLSKIEAGKMMMTLETFHIDDVASAALMMIRPTAAAKQIEVSASIPEHLPAITADSSKVKQILYNLLSNAVKFTPENGRVAVTATLVGSAVHVRVSDTGIGIAEEDRERIFSEFLQIDGSFARKYQGTGLGLALVKRFVEMHGGSIHVDSTPGNGSTFTFDLPVVGPPDTTCIHPPAPPPHAPAIADSPAGDDITRTIMVVEDNPINAKLVRQVLQRSGHNVIEARSGGEAMHKARAVRLDLILMDIQLPDMDGLEATASLKADPATRHIPTVALTAHAMKGDEERARRAGCCGYISKPIDVTRFPAQVDGFLRESVTS